MLALTVVLSAFHLIHWLLSSPPRGMTAVLLLLLTNLGVLSLGIGVLGEYIARIYAESKRRPLWLVDYSLNLDTPALGNASYAARTSRCTSRRGGSDADLRRAVNRA